MSSLSLEKALATASDAARAAGELMRLNWHRPKKVNLSTAHDIKLELDVRCQKLIEKTLARKFPKIPVLGEEGISGNLQMPFRWVVDPIDGTVNYANGIPHACVSIALQQAAVEPPLNFESAEDFRTVAGVVYDPFCQEWWTATEKSPARLNGRVIRVSRSARLNQAILSIGFAKRRATLAATLPALNKLIPRVRKVRIMGSAALALVYVASGRMDAYLERGISLWDIAAGGLILERAGGEFWRQPLIKPYTYRMISTNGLLRRPLTRLLKNYLD